jgi:hypothetical protein
MKGLINFLMVVLITLCLVGVSNGQDPQTLGIPQQLKTIQTQLTGIRTEVNQIQTTMTANSTWPRKYFITDTEYYPTTISAANACGTGYHFASLYEILEPSGLLYDTKNTLAFYHPADYDQGFGPPTFIPGWVRTGFASSADNEAPGQSNCNKWTTNNLEAFGTAVCLNGAWTNLYSSSDDYSPITRWWLPMAIQCNQKIRVWCVSD